MGPPNPLCYCGRHSRGQRTSAAKGQKLFYKCWDMKCRFWKWGEELNKHSDTFPTPPKASSSQGSWAPAVKVEKSDPFRSPSSTVIAPVSHVFQSPSAVKAPPKKAALQSPVQVSYSEVSPSPKKEPSPLPAANNDLKDGLSRRTLYGNGLPIPEYKRARSGRGWRRFLCCCF